MYNMSEIKGVSCADVAESRGVELRPSGGRLWGKIRNEGDTSFNITPRINKWIDFGTNKGGSVIDLVMELDNVSKNEAVNIIAKENRIEHIDGKETKGGTKWYALTDHQYMKCGIEYPERAIANFKIDLSTQSEEQVKDWAWRYRESMQALGLSNPKGHDQILRKKSHRLVAELLKNYKDCIRDAVKNEEIDDLQMGKVNKRLAFEYEGKINEISEMVNRGLVVPSLYTSITVDVQKDLDEEVSRVFEPKKRMIVDLYKETLDLDISIMSDKEIESIYLVNKAYSESLTNILPMGKEMQIMQDLIADAHKDAWIELNDKQEELDKLSLMSDSRKTEKQICTTSTEFFGCQKKIKELDILLKASVVVMNGMQVFASAEEIEGSYKATFSIDESGKIKHEDAKTEATVEELENN